jgi:hypothetical protein
MPSKRRKAPDVGRALEDMDTARRNLTEPGGLSASSHIAAVVTLRAALAHLGYPVAEWPADGPATLPRRVAALEARVAALERATLISPPEVAELVDVVEALERAASVAVYGVADIDDVG